MLAALATVALALALPYAATAARAPGALAYFEFTREQCLDGQFVDALGGSAIPSMNRDLAHTSCPDSLGVTFSDAVAGASRLGGTAFNDDVDDILAGWVASSEVTWDLWLKADQPAESFNKAFVFGLLFSQCSKSLKVEQTGDFATTTLAVTNDVCVTDTQTFSLRNTTHIAFVKQNGNAKMRVYINGEFLYSTTASVSMSGWPTGFPSMAFGFCSSCSKAWKGTMYSFAWYPYALDDTEILANYEHGIPRSDAVAYNLSVPINEDGWAVIPSNAEAFYSEAPVSELYEVTGMSFDLDDEPDNPNYDPNNFRTITITSLPDNCQLYTGKTLQPINSVPFQLTSVTGLSVRLRPTFNLASFSSSFEFHVTDATTLQPTHTHTVDFNVVPVNDPPVAAPTNGTFFSRVAQCIALDCTDVDNVVSELIFTIHDLPVHGQLYMCDGSGVPTTTFNDTDTVLPNHFVGYMYHGSEVGGSVLATEVLSFTVSDGQFNSSSAVTFTVIPRFVAEASYQLVEGDFVPTSSDADEYTVNEDGLAFGLINDTITIRAVDQTNTESMLQTVLESLPLTGSLLVDGQPAEIDNLMPMTNLGSGHFQLTFQYISAPDSFNSPSVDYYDVPLTDLTVPSFDFHVAVGDVHSMTVRQGIVVKNVNKAPQLAWTQTPLTTKASTKTDVQYLNISGFSIVDVDRDVDLLHVHVRCGTSCRLYLPKDDLSTYELCDACPCYVSRLLKPNGWICNLNNADALAEYHFVATPSRATQILNSMAFSSSTPDSVVPVTVTVYDGRYQGDSQDQGCIWWEKVKTRYPTGDGSSARTACYSSQVSFNVTVTGLAVDDAGGDSNINVQNVLIVFYTLLAYCLLSVLFFVFKFFRTICACCFIIFRKVKGPTVETLQDATNDKEQELRNVPRTKVFRPGEDTV